MASKETKIRVSCKCGKVLHVPLQYAGKRGRCPQCAKLLTVPQPETSREISETACPTCGSYLNLEDEVCISCHTNLKTGEWETVGKKQSNARFFSMLAANLLMLATILYLAIFYRSKPDIASKWNSIQALSEKNPREISAKLEKLQYFENTYLPLSVLQWQQCRERLVQKRHNLEFSRRCREIVEKNRYNPFSHWLQLELLKTKNTSAENALQKEILRAQKECVQLLRSYSGELEQLVQEKRLAEIVTRTTPQLLKLLGESLQTFNPTLETTSAWNSMLHSYKENPPQKKQPLSKTQFIYDRMQLEYYRKQYSLYLQRFKQWMYVREYDLAQQDMESLWESLHSLENIDKKDPLIATVRNNLREVQSVKALFSIAHEGAKFSEGKLMIFSLRNGNEFSGTVGQYAQGYFSIYTKTHKKVQISLKQLKAQEVVKLALKQQKNECVYRYAGILYFYEKNFHSAKKSFSQALKNGADEKIIQQYLEKIHNAKHDK